MLPLWTTLELDGGSSLTLHRWGQVDRETGSSDLMRFFLWFGETVLTSDVRESIAEQMMGILERLILRSTRLEKLPELSTNDLFNLADALWELNGLGGEGIPKVMARYSNVVEMRAKQMREKLKTQN